MANIKLSDDMLMPDLQENLKILKEKFNNDETVVFREFDCMKKSKINCCIIYIDFMVNQNSINEHILKPVMNCVLSENFNILNELQRSIIFSGNLRRNKEFKTIVESIINGSTVLIVDTCDEAIIVNTVDFDVRSIEEPQSETIVRGPREGFNESIKINMSLIRRKIKTPDLKFQLRIIGERTKTTICICYIDGLVQPAILQELSRRLDVINIDGILDSGYIEEFIRDEPLSPFRTIGSTERPDTVSAKLLEGRIALLCDGSPVALTLPFLFMEIFQINEDYYSNFIYASINRFLRWGSFILTTSIPAIYVALVNFHQEMLPTPLLMSILVSRQGVPFPTIVEALGMLIIFEILREAGTRIPKPIGQAVSIVGALVIGEAAVNARLVSAPMVIVTSLTGISGFLLPKLLSLSIIRIIFLILSSFLGFYGYIFSVMGLGILLMSMRSFGVPYMLNSGTGPIKFEHLKDTMIRVPWWLMKKRSSQISKDIVRMKGGKPIK